MAKDVRAHTVEEEIYRRHADMCKVLSHPKRLEVINTLRTGELSVSELARRLKITIGNLSQHLAMMKERGILLTRKQGNQVFYRLANPRLLEAFDILRDILFDQIRKTRSLIESR